MSVLLNLVWIQRLFLLVFQNRKTRKDHRCIIRRFPVQPRAPGGGTRNRMTRTPSPGHSFKCRSSLVGGGFQLRAHTCMSLTTWVPGHPSVQCIMWKYALQQNSSYMWYENVIIVSCIYWLYVVYGLSGGPGSQVVSDIQIPHRSHSKSDNFRHPVECWRFALPFYW